MSDSSSKPLLIAAGAVGSILLAMSSRSKRHAATERRRRCREAQEAAQIIISETSRQSTANRNQNGSLQGRENHSILTMGGVGGLPLLLHGLISLVLLYTVPSWQPNGIYDQAAWQHSIGLALLASLTVHILIALFSPNLNLQFSRFRGQRQVAPPAVPAVVSRPETILELNGVWTKDKEASDTMDPVCDLMELPRLMRIAVGMIRGVEIIADPNDSFQLNVLSGIMWFKIKEKYSLNGEEARHRRRDFRGGGSFGRAGEAVGGGVEVRHSFPSGNHAGTMIERFYCPEPNELRVDTFLEVPSRGPGISYRQVYRK